MSSSNKEAALAGELGELGEMYLRKIEIEKKHIAELDLQIDSAVAQRHGRQSRHQRFDDIISATGINDIDQLVNTFISAEQHNYKLYNQVKKLSNDLERVEKQILTTLKEFHLNEDHKADAMTRKTAGRADRHNRKAAAHQHSQRPQEQDRRHRGQDDRVQGQVLAVAADHANAQGRHLEHPDQDRRGRLRQWQQQGHDGQNPQHGRHRAKTNCMIAKYVVVSATASDKADKPSAPPQQVKGAMTGDANRQLDDEQTEAASLGIGIGIGAASLQRLLVATLYQHTR